MRVMIQTCADKLAYQHYLKTIVGMVPSDRLLKNIDRVNKQLLFNENLNKFPVWGMKSSRGKENTQWAKLEPGDYVLFYRKKSIISYAKVITKFHNRGLAEELWGNIDGSTWEYMYVLKDLVNISPIPADPLLNLVGYHKDFFQGSVAFDEELSIKICEYYDLSTGIECFDFQEYETVTDLDMQETDRKVSVNSRKEQSYLRNYLFNIRHFKKCAICGQIYNDEFLVTAHLKKRSICNREERLDIDNIVVPMCTFGCDVLYEKGYLGIYNGKVIILNHSKVNAAEVYIKRQYGKQCEYFKDGNRAYCEAHNRMFVGKEVLDEIYNRENH